MARAPIISIFPATGGPAVARGVLIDVRGDDGNGAPAGLFSPWPTSLSQEAFSVFIPPSPEFRSAEWLMPKEVGLLELFDKQGPKLGVVSFEGQPQRKGPETGITSADYLAIANDPRRSWGEALEAARGSELKQLRELARSAPVRRRTPPSGTAAIPRLEPMPTAAVDPGSFFCRYVLRWD